MFDILYPSIIALKFGTLLQKFLMSSKCEQSEEYCVERCEECKNCKKQSDYREKCEKKYMKMVNIVLSM